MHVCEWKFLPKFLIVIHLKNCPLKKNTYTLFKYWRHCPGWQQPYIKLHQVWPLGHLTGGGASALALANSWQANIRMMENNTTFILVGKVKLTCFSFMCAHFISFGCPARSRAYSLCLMVWYLTNRRGLFKTSFLKQHIFDGKITKKTQYNYKATKTWNKRDF